MNTIVQQIHSFDDLEKSFMIYNLRTFIPQYTQNNNGFFFNLTNYDKNTMDKIRKCIQVIQDNRKIISDSNKEREFMMNNYKNIVNTNVQQKNTDNIDIKRIFDYTNIHLDITPQIKLSSYQDPDVLIQKHKKKLALICTNYSKRLNILKKYKQSFNNENTYGGTDTISGDHSDKFEYSEYNENDQYYPGLDNELYGSNDFRNHVNDIDNESVSSIQSYSTEIDNNEDLSNSEIQRRLSICREILIEQGYVFDQGAYDILEYQEYLL